MARAASVESAARDRLCSPDAIRHRGVAADSHTARRLDETAALDAFLPATSDPTGDTASSSVDGTPVPGRWDPALTELVEQLVSQGADQDTTVEAVESVLDILQTTTSRSRVHTAAYRSHGLRLLLTRRQIQLLTDLLLGSRREGPDGSAWLLLRRAHTEGRSVWLAEAPDPFRRRATEFAATVCSPRPTAAIA